MKEIERRVINFSNIDVRELAEGEDEPVILGYAAVFNSLSEDLGGFRERIQPGAFSRSLVENNDIRALWGHDDMYVLGRRSAGTLELNQDDTGLGVAIKPPGTQWAKDLLTSMKRGDVNQMSFGFYVRGDKWDDKDDEGRPVRTLTDVDLFEVSVVAFPAYPQTSAEARSVAASLVATSDDVETDDERLLQVRRAAESRRREIEILQL